MSRTHCDHCNALVTPGAPFCLTCFLPFEDEPAVAAPAQAEVPAAVGAPAPQAPSDSFYAPPPPPANVSVDWRATAPAVALLSDRTRKPKSRTPFVVGCAVALVAVVGLVLGVRWMFASPSDRRLIATSFREGRPPDFLPSFPDLTSLSDAEPEAPGAATAYVQQIDARVRDANAAILAMQATMDRWADGDLTDEQLRAAITDFNAALKDVAADSFRAPFSTQRGLGKMREAATGYRVAFGSLLDWLDTESGGSRMMFTLSVGSANADWDLGLVNLYRAAGLPTPELPHPQAD